MIVFAAIKQGVLSCQLVNYAPKSFALLVIEFERYILTIKTRNLFYSVNVTEAFWLLSVIT